jgi:hypothetical protein
MAAANHVRGELRVMEAGGKPEIPATEMGSIGARARFDTQTRCDVRQARTVSQVSGSSDP